MAHPKHIEDLLAKLRRSRGVIDPGRTYRMVLPGGRVFEATGAELIETAEATLRLADAMDSGDEGRGRAALARWEADLADLDDIDPLPW